MKHLIITLCVIMNMACEQSQKEYLADLKARQVADELDSKVYLSLYEKEIVYGSLRQHFEHIYVNDCNLR